jgi:hypothetical protein
MAEGVLMKKKICFALFALVIFVMPIASFLQPYRTHSDIENRDFADFPLLSLDSYLSRGFANGFNQFISDHFFARDQWMVIHTDLTLLTGSNENGTSTSNGDEKSSTQNSDQGGEAFLGKGCLIGDLLKPDDPANLQVNGKYIYQNNTDAVEKFAQSHSLPVYLMVAPTAEEIESDKLPPFAQTWSQRDWLNTIAERLNAKRLNKTSLINVIDTLTAHKNEYVYYRTDHHWTSLGAYYAYAYAGKALGYTPLPFSQFTVEHATNDFDGTLYNESGYRSVKPDTIDFYHNKDGDNFKKLVITNGGSTKTYNSIYFRNWLTQADKYNAFFNSNNTIETVYTGNGSKKLLVIKDSYALSLVPFLMNNYSEITMIDMRGIGQTVDQLVNVKDYNQVLFMYNADEFNTQYDVQNVN